MNCVLLGATDAAWCCMKPFTGYLNSGFFQVMFSSSFHWGAMLQSVVILNDWIPVKFFESWFQESWIIYCLAIIRHTSVKQALFAWLLVLNIRIFLVSGINYFSKTFYNMYQATIINQIALQLKHILGLFYLVKICVKLEPCYGVFFT